MRDQAKQLVIGGAGRLLLNTGARVTLSGGESKIERGQHSMRRAAAPRPVRASARMISVSHLGRALEEL
ncbi:hypothetical protein BRAO375_130003 [Bradyrhizobium sp. ORS 375]|nr:hypothetical protein BRAO375_130003 [Bradyrhizobium sp. ORS 375]